MIGSSISFFLIKIMSSFFLLSIVLPFKFSLIKYIITSLNYIECTGRSTRTTQNIPKTQTLLNEHVQNKDIGDGRQCSEDCFICTTSQNGDCRASGVTYKIECGFVYTEGTYEYNGKMMKNGYSQGIEHLNKLNKKAEDSALWNHYVKKHDGVMQKFSMLVRDKCKNDPTLLHIMEAIRIRDVDEVLSMNSATSGIRIPNAEIRD